MFTRLSRLASRRSSRTSSHEDRVEQISLMELNVLLEVLAEVFPEHELALIRELLLNASQESRLHMAANAIIQNQQRSSEKTTTRLKPGSVEGWEKFRSTKYKKTVEKLLVAEYQGLAKSTIRNVLSESNYDYVRGREALSDIASKSWRFSLTAWISRRKAPPPRPHLDVMKKSTGCTRLDDEIYALGRPEREAQSLRDEEMAKEVNEDEYARAHELLECECCFGDYTWEDMTVCTEGHFFCRGCLDRSVKEALYGQGSCLYREKGSVRCISSVADPACEGFVAAELLPHALPAETLDKVDQRFACDQLQTSGLQLMRCPACSYAAVDNSIAPHLRPWAIAALPFLAASILGLCMHLRLRLLITSAQFLAFFLVYRSCIDLCNIRMPHMYNIPAGFRAAQSWTSDAIMRVRRRKTGVRKLFTCENPRCGMPSCIDCGKEWAAFHDCHREAQDSQRLYVERAMSEAVKRTCPQCHTSFVKSDGCNMLTCPCGYEMCYVCRADVRGVRYKHFCQHFRLVAGAACTACEQCNLYETEDEQAVATAAAQRAAEEWAASRRGGATSAGVQPIRNVMPVERLLKPKNAWPSWLEWHLEGLIELVYEW